ncbi:uncharacterized protein [Manis javanica]|uniref:uncharacterized protein isoform X3 n=1 Tax=Manis javanica TaxID=9974 RepID=UPI003C6DA314
MLSRCVEGDSEDGEWTHQRERGHFVTIPSQCSVPNGSAPSVCFYESVTCRWVQGPGQLCTQLLLAFASLGTQLQAPPARGLSSLSPAAPARTAAPGSLGEERVFPHPRTGFLAGPDLGHAQHLAARPLRLLKGSRGTQPAACSRPAAQDTEGEDNPWGVDVRRGGMCRPSLAPACRKPAGLPPLPRGLPSPAPVMSDGASCELWPLLAAPQGLWGADPLSWDALGCLMPQAIQAHPDCDDRAVLLGGGVTCHMLPENCGEDTGTMAQPRRARLYRCHPPIQTSKSSLAPPATLPLKEKASGMSGLRILPCVNRHRPLEGPGRHGLQLWAVPAAGHSSPVSTEEKWERSRQQAWCAGGAGAGLLMVGSFPTGRPG